MRRLVAEDADWLYELDSDPEVMRFISGGIPTPRETFLQVYLPRMLQSHPPGPQFGFWVGALCGSGEMVGWFHLRPEKLEPHEMELGYRLRKAFWRRGLATEGSLEFLRRAFKDWRLPSVVAHTLERNAASRRVMEKCGMKWERDFVYPEAWLPDLPENQRRAVRYRIDEADFRRSILKVFY